MVNKEKAIALRNEGLTYKEIAEILGCSVVWCKKNLKGVKVFTTQDRIDRVDRIFRENKEKLRPYLFDDIKQPKFIRTQMKVGNDYISARLNTETGEIKPYNYNKPKELPKATPKKSQEDGFIPLWVKDAEAMKNISIEDEIDYIVAVLNDVYCIFSLFSGYNELIKLFPFIDDIVTGASFLGDNNQLSINKLFYILSNSEYIDGKFISKLCTMEIRQANRYAIACRIINNALIKHVPKIISKLPNNINKEDSWMVGIDD